MERNIPDAGGNVCKTEKSGYADRTVPEARHDTGAIPYSYPGAIFIIGDIPYPVKPILDVPVPPV
jgi:hypothetical protein